MIREVKFESQDRRIKGIIEALNANGIKDIEEANAIYTSYSACDTKIPGREEKFSFGDFWCIVDKV